MIESTSAVSAATTGGATYPGTKAAAKTTKSFAHELARSASTAASSGTNAAARPDGEQTKKITGHPYSRVENGADKGLFLNQLVGSPRKGSAFRLVERDDRVFHVYGSGTDRVIVEVKAQGKSDATSTTSTAPTTSTTSNTSTSPTTPATP